MTNDKNVLRKEMREKLKKISCKTLEENSKIVAEKTLELECVKNAKKICVYLNFSSEIITDNLIEKLLELNKEIFVPKIVSDSEMKAVRFYKKDDFFLDKYGIRTPKSDDKGQDFDVILMPLLAVDKSGRRLGRGKGYYDRFLNGEVRAKKVVLCHQIQVVERVPFDNFDKKVDIIVTEENTILVSE